MSNITDGGYTKDVERNNNNRSIHSLEEQLQQMGGLHSLHENSAGSKKTKYSRQDGSDQKPLPAQDRSFGHHTAAAAASAVRASKFE